MATWIVCKQQQTVTTTDPIMEKKTNEHKKKTKQECTLISKERRHALRITQGPRSRASLAALPCHSSLQTTHMSLGGTYSSAIEDWLSARQKPTKSTHNQFQLCDSVPDLSTCDGDFIIQSTKHAIPTSLTPRKIPSTRNGGLHPNNIMNNNNFLTNLTNGYEASLRIQNINGSSLTKPNNNNYKKISGSTTNAMSTITQPMSTSTTATSASITNIEYDNDNNEVHLRRNAINRNDSYENKTNDKQNDWMYRRPTAPNDIRHSCKHLFSSYYLFAFWFYLLFFSNLNFPSNLSQSIT